MENNNREYALLEADNRLSKVINCMDARQRIAVFKLEKYEDSVACGSQEQRLENIDYVYELMTLEQMDKDYKDYMEEYVVDYMRFSFDCVVIVIKPNKWKK